MKDEINQHERAFKTWDILVDFCKQRQPLTYGQLANLLNLHPRAIRFILDIIFDYCEENNFPALTMIVLNKATNLPGAGFTEYNINSFDEDLQEVFNFNWGIQNPFSFAASGNTESMIIDQILDKKIDLNNIYAQVKVRGAIQMLFRKALLIAYDHMCAICNFSFIEGLEAAHIIPYADCTREQRLQISNGILLCSTHHKLFDYGYILIAENYQIDHEPTKEEYDTYTKMDKLLTKDFHGKFLRLPLNKAHAPNKKYLKYRLEES